MIDPARTVLICLVMLLLNQPALAVRPLRDQWATACRFMELGQPAEALAAFNEFETWYGQEPLAAEPDFNESRIRLWALAALQAGNHGQAVDLLERWFEENPDTLPFRAFLRYQLVELHLAMGEREAATKHRQHFLIEHPDLPECALIRWQIADEAIAEGLYPEAVAQFDAILANPVLPATGRELAAAALAMVSYASGDKAAVVGWMADDEPPASGILRFWRAILAPGMVRHLLDTGRPDEAVRVAHWLDHPTGLAAEVAALQEHLARATPHAGIRQSVWNNRWKGQLDRLQATLQRASVSDGESRSSHALRLSALLANGEPARAAILGRALIRSSGHIPKDLPSVAYRRTIEARLAMRQWKRAEGLATEFLEAYPDHPAIPDILFLNARNAAARSEFETAVALVSDLLDHHAGHRAEPSWRILQAGWILQAGRPVEAKGRFDALAQSVPRSWEPFLSFQSARCLEAMNRHRDALDGYMGVFEQGEAATGLRHTAAVSALQLAMGCMDPPRFRAILKACRQAGLTAPRAAAVANIEAAFHQRLGQTAKAERIYRSVAGEAGEPGSFARRQLSGLYLKSHDMDNLLRHAIEWIRLIIDQPVLPDTTPFTDLLEVQRQTGRPALPRGLAGDLVDRIAVDPGRLPADRILEVLGNQWAAYGGWFGVPDFEEWLGRSADRAFRAGLDSAFAAFQLHAARRLERAGRIDSADTRRIRVLQSVEARLLGSEALFSVAVTADRYDFPEAPRLLRRFLDRHPLASQRPEALLLLAGWDQRTGKPAAAMPLLGEIVREWPDATVWPEAALRLARMHLEASEAGKALAVLDDLLGSGGLAPACVAEGLMLRADADVLSGNGPRAQLGCQRILTLYPDFHDVCLRAETLLARIGEFDTKDSL